MGGFQSQETRYFSVLKVHFFRSGLPRRQNIFCSLFKLIYSIGVSYCHIHIASVELGYPFGQI